jgi:tetratricopeptide (TPR) repeat protein
VDLRTDRPAEVRAAAHVARGRFSLARGRAVEALRDFEDAKRIDRRLAEAYAGAAEAYLTQGLLDGARVELEAGLAATQPQPSAEILVTLAGVQLARGTEPRQVLSLLHVARQVNPDEPRIPRSFAATFTAEAERSAEKGDLTAAEASVRAALEEVPDFAAAHAALGRVREQQKRHGEAAQSLERAYRIEPTKERRDAVAAALKAAGMAALLQRDRERAVARFLELRDLGTVNVDMGSGLDLLREEARSEYNRAVDSKDPSEARRHLERSLRCLPENFYALYALGTLEAEAGGDEHSNDVKAIELWTRALAAGKESGVDLSSLALHWNLAQAHYRRREDAKARVLLTEYLAFGKGDYAPRCQALLEVLEATRR